MTLTFLQKVGAYLVFINIVTFYTYFRDKRAAEYGGWRTPERVLFMMILAGGTPAAFIASKLLRHKNRKYSFRAVFWFIVAVQFTVISVYMIENNVL